MAHCHFGSEEARQVTFSKGIAMLFKEVSDFSIMCDIEVAAVIFSPTGQAFSFGHPSVEAILERFAPANATHGGGCAYIGKDKNKLAKLKEYKELCSYLNAEKARKVRAEEAMAKEHALASLGAAWLEADVHDLGEEDLIAYTKVLAVVSGSASNNNNGIGMTTTPPPGFGLDGARTEI
uniref:Uncharacterized protein n=1 Tax=Avena sativa TaxID=4498 RepID=A0ACD5WNG1_AVESA